MSRKSKTVTTGLEYGGLIMRARAYVSPSRLSYVEEEARVTGRIRLGETDRLHIDVASSGEQFHTAISFVSADEDRHLFNGFVEWVVRAGPFAAYASNAEMLEGAGRSIARAIEDENAGVTLDHRQFSSAMVGNILVVFEGEDRKKVGPIDEVDEDAWPSKSDADHLDDSRIKRAEAHLQVLKAKRALREAGLGPEAA